MKGVLKRIPPNKDFGFIMASNGVDHFLHASEFKGKWKELVDALSRNIEVRMTFDSVENGSKGMRANNCKRLENGNVSAE